MKKSIIVYCHIAFWALLFGTELIKSLIIRFISIVEYGNVSVYLTYFTPIFFYLGYFGIMKLLKLKGFLLYAIPFAIFSYLALFLISKQTFAYAVIPFSSVFMWFTFGGLFRFFVDWFQKRSSILSLQKENVKSQLALLRTQINPHFLFNTLNNIDSLIKENPDNASNSLSKLSEIMRYMLNDKKTEKIRLKDEIDFIQNYISLERLRLKNDDFLKVDIEGDCGERKIASMLLIPFVENAFKHSVDSTISNGITINFVIDKNKLIFSCKNKFDDKENERDKTHGIGLETVKKRLNMIYPQRHSLNIINKCPIFEVRLEIVLDEN